jgi:hypothetical protein
LTHFCATYKSTKNPGWIQFLLALCFAKIASIQDFSNFCGDNDGKFALFFFQDSTNYWDLESSAEIIKNASIQD